MKVLLDTNSLIYAAQYGIDIKQLEDVFQKPIEFFTTQSVLRELEEISRTRKKSSVYAKIAIQLLEKSSIKILPSKHKHADKDILAEAEKGFVVVTNDRKLKEQLKKKSIGVLSIREFRKLDQG